MRRVTTLLVAAALLGTVAVGVAPASAGDGCSDGTAETTPDGKVARVGEAFVGAGSFGQAEINTAVPDGQRVKLVLRWKNLTERSRRIRFIGGTEGNDGVAKRVLVDGVNVIGPVLNNDFSVPGVKPGHSVTLEVVLKNKAGGEPTPFDAVRIQARYGGTPPSLCDQLGGTINVP